MGGTTRFGTSSASDAAGPHVIEPPGDTITVPLPWVFLNVFTTRPDERWDDFFLENIIVSPGLGGGGHEIGWVEPHCGLLDECLVERLRELTS